MAHDVFNFITELNTVHNKQSIISEIILDNYNPDMKICSGTEEISVHVWKLSEIVK